MPIYAVKGRGIETGRKRSRSFHAKNEAEARILAEKDGTTVEEIEELPPEPATEKQIEYAKELGISIPESISLNDLSDLITRTVRKDKPTTERHRSFGKIFGIEVSEYVGKKELFNRIQYALISHGREIELSAWFTFRVYRELMRGKENTPIKDPNDPTIQEIAKKLASDEKIVKSIKRYEGLELIWFGQWTAPDGYVMNGGSNRTAAYKAAAAELRAKVFISAVSKPKVKITEKKTTQSFSNAHASVNNKQGCMPLIAMAIVTPPVLFGVVKLVSAMIA